MMGSGEALGGWAANARCGEVGRIEPMRRRVMSCLAVVIAVALTALNVASASAQGAIDNSTLSSPAFREHKHTFGLVYTLPAEVNAHLDRTISGLLREKLLNAKLY